MFQIIARIGIAAKGACFILIGVLALLYALGVGGSVSGKTGAMVELAAKPYGRVVLFVLALGLACHVVWRFGQALLDTERLGHGLGPLFTRVGYFFLGTLYSGLCASAVQLATLQRTTVRDDQQERKLVSLLLEQPFGKWLVMGVGIGFLAAGVVNLIETARASFKQRLRLASMGTTARKLAVRSGRVGVFALSVMCFLIAMFFFFAARDASPRQARGLRGVLAFIVSQPYGHVLLAVFACGLFAYGAFELIEARYRRL